MGIFGFKIEEPIDYEYTNPVGYSSEEEIKKDLEKTVGYLMSLEDQSLLDHLRSFYKKANQKNQKVIRKIQGTRRS